MGSKRTPAQVTILPAQAQVLSKLAQKHGCAIGITQNGSVLKLDPGKHHKPIFVDAQGNTVTYLRRPGA